MKSRLFLIGIAKIINYCTQNLLNKTTFRKKIINVFQIFFTTGTITIAVCPLFLIFSLGTKFRWIETFETVCLFTIIIDDLEKFIYEHLHSYLQIASKTPPD